MLNRINANRPALIIPAQQRSIVSFDVPVNATNVKNFDELLNRCIRANINLNGITILTTAEARQHRALDRNEMVLDNCAGRIIIDRRFVHEYAQFNNSVIELRTSLEDRLRGNIRRLIRLRKATNLLPSTLQNLRAPDNKFVEGMIFPAEYLQGNAQAATDTHTTIYIVIKNANGTREYRFHVKPENARPGDLLIGVCVRYSVNGCLSKRCCCKVYAQIPLDKTIEQLYFGSILCMVECGEHTSDCIYHSDTRFCRNQTNVGETQLQWYTNQQRCIRRRARQAVVHFNTLHARRNTLQRRNARRFNPLR